MQKPAQGGQSQLAQSQNTSRAEQSQGPNIAASKTTSIDNNIATPWKECESREHVFFKKVGIKSKLNTQLRTTCVRFIPLVL